MLNELIMRLQPTQIFSGKGKKKELTLELSEDEDLFDCIKQGMQENNISKASITEIKGKIKSGSMNFMLGSRFRAKEIKNSNVVKASGEYELNGNKLYGNMHVLLENDKSNGTLSKAKVSEGTKVILSFVEIQ